MAEQAIPSAVAVNKINAAPTFKLKLVCGAADVSDIYLKGYAGNPASQSMPAGVTLSSDIGDSAATLDYLSKVPLHISQIQLQSDNVVNFQEELKYGVYLPPFSGQTPKQDTISIAEYRWSPGNGYSDVTLPIQKDMLLVPNFFLKLTKLKANSTLTITLTTPDIDAGGTFVPVAAL